MMNARLRVAMLALLMTGLVRAGDSPSPEQAAPTRRGVSEIVMEHDRALTKELTEYLKKNPKAEDAEKAYMIVFEKAIDHDWYIENEALAQGYLTAQPEGPVRPLALIVASLAKGDAGKHDLALDLYKQLLKGLDRDDQKEFATNFGEKLATLATAGGNVAVARKIYESILEKYGESRELRNVIQDNLDRLAMVDKPAPVIVVRDLQGKPFRLSELKEKYVLIDFWATWCGPCLSELPNLEAAYTKYHKKGLEIVGVSLDETVQPVKDFVKERNVPWRQIHNGTAGFDVVEAFGVNNIPATFLVGPDGKIIRLELRGANLEKALAQLIKD
jgi:thiol-disulfide isomerase/thioredoxin